MIDHPEGRPAPAPRTAVWIVGGLVLMAFAGLAFAVLSLPPAAQGLTDTVLERIDSSGVKNPVTAVLLNFRGYDTLLEMVVLLLALVAVVLLAPEEDWEPTAPSSVLDAFTQILIPVMVVIAGYLLWTGKDHPGGAFQAGAVLASAGVLALLTGFRLPPHLTVGPLRLVAIAGVAAFVLVGAGVMASGSRFLEYPVALAGWLILLIEACATLAIGLTLVSLFRGGRLGAGL